MSFLKTYVVVLCAQVAACAYLDIVREAHFPDATELRVVNSKFVMPTGDVLLVLEMGDLRMPTPMVTDTVQLPVHDVQGLAVDGGRVVLSGHNAAVLVQADDEKLSILGETEHRPTNTYLAVPVQDMLFVFSSKADKARVEIYSVSRDWGSRELRVSIDLIAEVVDAVTFEHMVYAISSKGYIFVFDSSKTGGYALRSVTPTLKKPTCLTMFIDFLYVGVEDELRAYQVHPTGNLEEASESQVGSSIHDVYFTRGNIYAATDAGLTIIDVKDPRHPFESGYRSTPSPARSMEVFIDIAYIVTVDGQLLMIDVVPPENEVSLMTTPTPTVAARKHATWEEADVKVTTVGFAGSSFGMVEVENDMVAWSDLPESHFFDLPEWLIDGKSYATESTIPQDTRLKIECADRVCNVFIFFEHCLPCSTASNGGLPSILVGSGWIPSSCGPKFKVRSKGLVHNTVIFRKQLRKGAIEILSPLVREAKYLGIAIVEGRNMCKDIGSSNECNTGTFLCAWDDVVGGCMPKVTKCTISKRKSRALRPSVGPLRKPEGIVQRAADPLAKKDSPATAPHPRVEPPGPGSCRCAAFEL